MKLQPQSTRPYNIISDGAPANVQPQSGGRSFKDPHTDGQSSCAPFPCPRIVVSHFICYIYFKFHVLLHSFGSVVLADTKIPFEMCSSPCPDRFAFSGHRSRSAGYKLDESPYKIQNGLDDIYIQDVFYTHKYPILTTCSLSQLLRAKCCSRVEDEESEKRSCIPTRKKKKK